MQTYRRILLLLGLLASISIPISPVFAQSLPLAELRLAVKPAVHPHRVELLAEMRDTTGAVPYDLNPAELSLFADGSPVSFELLDRPTRNHVMLVLDVSDTLSEAARTAIAGAYSVLLPHLFSLEPDGLPVPLVLSVMVPGAHGDTPKLASHIADIDAFNQLLGQGAIAGPGGRPRQQTQLRLALQAALSTPALATIIISDAADPTAAPHLDVSGHAMPVFSLVYVNERSNSTLVDELRQLSRASQGAFLPIIADDVHPQVVRAAMQIKRLATPAFFRLTFNLADLTRPPTLLELRHADGLRATAFYQPLPPTLDQQQPDLHITQVQWDAADVTALTLSLEASTHTWRRPSSPPALPVALQVRTHTLTHTLQLSPATVTAAAAQRAESVALVVTPEVGATRAERVAVLAPLRQTAAELNFAAAVVTSADPREACSFTTNFTALVDSTLGQSSYGLAADIEAVTLQAIACAAEDGAAQQRPAHVVMVLHRALSPSATGQILETARSRGVSIHTVLVSPDPTGLMADLAMASGGIDFTPDTADAAALIVALRAARPLQYTAIFAAPLFPNGEAFTLSLPGSGTESFEAHARRAGAAQLVPQLLVLSLMLVGLVGLLSMPWIPLRQSPEQPSDPFAEQREAFIKAMAQRGRSNLNATHKRLNREEE